MKISVQNRHQRPILPLNHRQKKDGGNTWRRQSLRGRSPSGKLARQSCRDCIKAKCTRPSCDLRHPPEFQCYKNESGCKHVINVLLNRQVEIQPSEKLKNNCNKSGKSARMHTVRLMNSRLKGPKRMMTRVQWPCWRRMICTKAYGNLLSTVTKVKKDRGDPISSVIPVMSWNKDLLDVDHRTHDNRVAYFRTSSRRNLHRFYGRAQKSWHQLDVCNSQKPHCVTQTFEKAKVHRLV